ncbi:MAG: hydroxymethylbilane synthase [Rickettsiales bacterium]|nr:hydroxymethylbilane synthase [Rickettsiales bacterium]OUV82953.1 MAG: hydroxymethylbilane synthase [Rickettsiales bacterium TMED131]
MINKKIVIGSRSSELAKIQTQLVVSMLNKAGYSKIEVLYFRSKGDRVSNKEFKANGGKGLFTKEIDQLILNKKIDIGVHSAKDIPGHIDPRLKIGAFLKREDIKDVIITKNTSIKKLNQLPKNITLGTSSPRRTAYIKLLRPDIKIIHIRGNIETRINKVLDKKVYSILLAKAAINRLNLQYNNLNILSVPISQIFPSPGQGAIAIMYNKESLANKKLCRLIDCKSTRFSVNAERALIRQINGDCFTPIGAYAKIKNENIILNACLFSNDMKYFVKEKKIGPKSLSIRIGKECGNSLLKKIKKKTS